MYAESIQAKHEAKVYRVWLQTMFPVIVADRCIQAYWELRPTVREAFNTFVFQHWKEGFFQRYLIIPQFWHCDKDLTRHCGSFAVESLHGVTETRKVFCAQPFERLMKQYACWPLGSKDAKQTLVALLEKCVPHASKIFTGNYEVSRLLHMNDYVLEKTFVYAIVCLSKWMGSDLFPQGIYGHYPPAAPTDIFDRDPAPHQDVVPVSAETQA